MSAQTEEERGPASYAEPALTRDAMILSLVPLVGQVARRMSRGGGALYDYDDLVSEGMIGAIGAVDRYDPDTATSLRSFAYMRIKGAILDYLRKVGPLSRQHHKEVQESGETFWVGSLDAPIFSKDDSAVTLIDLLPDDEDTISRMIDVMAIQEVIGQVPEQHREILVEYYYEGLKLKAIGERHGYTESRACQRLNRAHDWAYHFLEKDSKGG